MVITRDQDESMEHEHEKLIRTTVFLEGEVLEELKKKQRGNWKRQQVENGHGAELYALP